MPSNPEPTKISFWLVKGRPLTEKRAGENWVAMSASEQLVPEMDYRVGITWGVRMRRRVSEFPENWLENVTLRIVFDGWKIGASLVHRNSMQFFQDPTYASPVTPPYRIHLHQGSTQYGPDLADSLNHAYFRLTRAGDIVSRMQYNVGIYGGVYQHVWKHVLAQ